MFECRSVFFLIKSYQEMKHFVYREYPRTVFLRMKGGKNLLRSFVQYFEANWFLNLFSC